MNNGTGVLAGYLGCFFGLFGILTIGIVFVPLAVLCSGIGICRSLLGGSLAGFCVSSAGMFLALLGFVVSPSLWLLLGLTILAHH